MNKKKRRKITLMCLSTAAILGCVGSLGARHTFNNPVRAYAASTGNWYIQNIDAAEKTDHSVYMAILNSKAYSESFYFNTGITVYSPSNTGSTYGSSSLRVSSNSFYIDFTGARKPRTPVTNSNEEVMIDTKYCFEVYSSSGSVVFYERFEANDPLAETTLNQRYYGYGVSSKRITLESDKQNSENVRVDPAYFGKRNLSLADGSYTIKISREYVWVKSTANDKGIYKATSLMTVPLLVDGTAPTVSMKDSNSKTVSNGSYVNKNVTVTANDANLSGLYYKTPGSSSYSYASKTYTTSGTNGWYYFYAKDSVDSQSDVYSFYLDTVKPTGTIRNGSSVLASGSSTKGSFSYVPSDSGSGIANTYYRIPGTTSYTSYTPGTIIPNTAGDGWYYFYCFDKAGNISTTSSIRLDTGKPTGKIMAGGNEIQSGGSTNSDFSYSASDAATGIGTAYVKKPGSSDYVAYVNGSIIPSSSGDGWYYFYAKDGVGNISETMSVLLDTTKPEVYVSSGGTKVSNGSYISGAFAYNASDGGSGISKIFYKSPVTGSFVEYSNGSIIPNTAGDGWYEFYAVDNTGNVSETFRVYLETSQPLVNIYRNGEVAFSVSMTNGGNYDTGIYFNRNDVMRITCDTSSGNVSSNFDLSTDYRLDESYSENTYTISVTTATGIRSSFVYRIIDEKPCIKIGDTRYESGETLYFNRDTEVGFIADSIQKDDEKTGITINGSFSSYKDMKDKILTSDDNVTTTYNISMNDRAGNVSRFTIVIDKESPKAVWKDSDGNPVGNGNHTNKDVSLDFEEAGLKAAYSYNGGEYSDYSSGIVFSEEGSYNVVITDLAGNKSTYSVVIDKTAPIGRLYSDYQVVADGSITNGKVYFTWDEDCTATVNGREYAKNSVISEEGSYEFILTDKAGNSTSYHVEIDLTAPSANKDAIDGRHEHIVSKWYNVDFDGKKTSFATYQEALDYACDLEFGKYVTTLYLDDVSKFTQTHLIASGEVHVGNYYRYKSVSSSTNELYYFDEDGLRAAIESYAKSYVSDVKYFNPSRNDLGDVGNDFMYSDTWTYEGGSAPLINGYKFSLTDSRDIYARFKGETVWNRVQEGIAFEEQFHETGLYEIREVDAAGNEIVYEVFLDLSSPYLSVRAEVFGEGESKDITVSKDAVSEISAYYYKSFDIQEILDNDPHAVISVTSGGTTKFYSAGDELPTLSEGGKYDISVYDRLGNSYSFTVYIVGNEANVSFRNNSDDTAFDVDIGLEQDFDAIVSLEIYKDGKKLDGVSPEIMHYTFDKDGTYTVIIRDNFGRTIERTYEFDKALPEGLLSCREGSKTNENVSFTYDNTKYYAEVYKDGVLIGTDASGAVSYSDDGSYSIKLINLTDEDNSNTYSFVIDKTAPKADLNGVEDKGKTNGDVTVSWTDRDVASATYTVNGGDEISFENGSTFTKEGTYVITLKDDLGNTTTKTFTIDKTLDYEVRDMSGISEAGTDITTSGNVVISNNEDLHIEVRKDGESYNYSFGDSLSDEGRYEIRIYDDIGNSSTFTVIIDKSVDYSSNVSDGMTTNEDVWFANGEKSTVIVTKDGSPYPYGWGEKITEEGTYVVKMYDSYGNEETLTFTIDKSVDFSSNVNDREATNKDVIIDADEDVTITVTKDGEAIDYKIGDALTADGHYSVTIKDAFGNESSFSFDIDKTAPEITITGIEDGGKGDAKVILSDMTEEGEIHVYKDGTEIDYELGQELSDYGKYEIVVKDKLGNSRTYSFELAYEANGAAIALICIGVALLAGAVVLIILKKKRVFKK